MKIGDLANLTGTQVETIRYYEREGLLPEPARTATNYRIYDVEHVERLAFIRRCRSLDMGLDEVRVLLGLKDKPSQSCEDANRVLDEHLGHVTQRIDELVALKAQLESLRSQCGEAKESADCGILKELSNWNQQPSQTGHQHIDSVHGLGR